MQINENPRVVRFGTRQDETYIRYDGTEYVKMTTGMTVVTPTPRPMKPVKTSVMAIRDGVTKARSPQNTEMRRRERQSMMR